MADLINVSLKFCLLLLFGVLSDKIVAHITLQWIKNEITWDAGMSHFVIGFHLS